MKISIVYDNEALPGLEDGWGFACLVDHPGGRLLFDTGGSEDVLAGNLRAMGIDPGSIDTVVISHDHWDHTGGLPAVVHPDVTVYVPATSSPTLLADIESAARVVKVGGSLRIAPGIHTTGELPGSVGEQSLALQTDLGVTVITGCAHPGLKRIMEKASEFGEVRAVLGGFHDFKDLDFLEGLELVCPGHCTSMKDEIMGVYPRTSVPLKVGVILEV